MVDVRRQTLCLDLAVLAVAAAVGSELYFPRVMEAGLREEQTETVAVAVAVAELALSSLHHPSCLDCGGHEEDWGGRVVRRP